MTKVVIKAADGVGAVDLYHNANLRFETNSEGVEITGKMTFDSSVSGRTIRLDDDQKLFIGTGHDLKLWHDGAHSYIQDEGTGALRIRSDSEVAIQSYVSSTNKNMAKFIPDGAVELYHNDTKKFETTSSGINIGGNLAANPFDYLRFGASQYGAADIRPVNEGSHKVGLAFYVDGTADTTINPTEKVRIQAAGGISFNGDTAPENALDDYEEGSWTITFPNSGSAAQNSSGHTKGRYVKIGSLVYVHFFVYFGSGGTVPPNNATVFKMSLPFSTPANHANAYSRHTFTVMHQEIKMDNSREQIVGYLTHSDNDMRLYECGDDLTWQSMKNSGMDRTAMQMYISGCFSTV
jgi:hypothetical protein